MIKYSVPVYFRTINTNTMLKVVEQAMELYRDFPDIMAGFDLVRDTFTV